MKKHHATAFATALLLSAAAGAQNPILQQLAPSPTIYVFGAGNDFTQGPGTIADVTASLWAIDLMLPPAAVPSSTSGCEAGDFAGFAAGSIALMQRGTCDFYSKLTNAAAAGAVGALIFNEGQAGRTEAIPVTTLPDPAAPIPWFFLSFDLGNELAGGVLNGSTGRTMRIATFSTDTLFAPVPEPATWAMMLLGFGAIGFAMRRQRKFYSLARTA